MSRGVGELEFELGALLVAALEEGQGALEADPEVESVGEEEGDGVDPALALDEAALLGEPSEEFREGRSGQWLPGSQWVRGHGAWVTAVG